MLLLAFVAALAFICPVGLLVAAIAGVTPWWTMIPGGVGAILGALILVGFATVGHCVREASNWQ